MFLHALTPNKLAWWAVHAETLTPVHIEIAPGCIANLRVATTHDAPAGVAIYRSHPARNDTRREIALTALEDIRRNFYGEAKTGTITSVSWLDVPEYLMVFKASGENPGIFHTQFPRMIVPSLEGDDETLGPPSHWIVNEDLSGEGWAYYLEGCQQALDELAPAFLAAAGS